MKIVEIKDNSPLFGQIAPGAALVSVNGHRVADDIDFQYHNTEDILEIEIDDGGRHKTFSLDAFACGDLGLRFEETKIRICNNNCIFCFVHQQPKGMRRSLYIKDDDYRYSFTHGNFVSLSRMTEADYLRIIEQRLSPLYISVHATDDELRRCIFKNEKLEPILPRLRDLTAKGIAVHTQTVVCPGINDGAQLDRTITELGELATGRASRGVQSLAVVPVGLTRYRDRLPKLRMFTSAECRGVIGQVRQHQARFREKIGSRFVWPADEFYLAAGLALPSLSSYEDMPQFENGVGMARQFISDFNRRKRYLPKGMKKRTTVAIVTGHSAKSFMRDTIVAQLRNIRNLKVELTVVDNHFWGRNVTVTGLLTGADCIAALKRSAADYVLLPPNCLNIDELFLDDVTLNDFTARVGRPVFTGTYMISDLVGRVAKMQES